MLDEEGNNPFEVESEERDENSAVQYNEPEDIESEQLRPTAPPEKIMMEHEEKNKKSKAGIILVILFAVILIIGF